MAELYRDREIPGFVHTSLGQEAVAAGVCAALAPDDYITTTHRGHGHCSPRAPTSTRMMAELFARVHRPLPRQGRLDARRRPGDRASSARTRSSAPACRSRSAPRSRASCSGRAGSPSAFFGEGAVNQGVVPRGAQPRRDLGPAGRSSLCENNVYAEFTDSRTMTRVPSVVERAAAYGIEAVTRRRQRRRGGVRGRAASAVARCREARARPDRGRDLPLARPLRGRRRSPTSPRTRPRLARARPAARRRRERCRRRASTDGRARRSCATRRTPSSRPPSRPRAPAPPPALEEAYEHVYRD